MMEEKPITDPQATRDELVSESTLRPSTLADFVGQSKVKENLAVFIEAAGRRILRLTDGVLIDDGGANR